MINASRYFAIPLFTLSIVLSAENKEPSQSNRYVPTTCLTLEKKGRGYDRLDVIENNVIGFYSMNGSDMAKMFEELDKEKPNQSEVQKLRKKILNSPVNLVFDYKKHPRQLLKDYKAYKEFVHRNGYKMRTKSEVDLEWFRLMVDKLPVFFLNDQ
jgi:hypothetical protein